MNNPVPRKTETKKPRKQPEQCAKEERKMRDNLSEKQIDKTLQDSFPASDPPSTY